MKGSLEKGFPDVFLELLCACSFSNSFLDSSFEYTTSRCRFNSCMYI